MPRCEHAEQQERDGNRLLGDPDLRAPGDPDAGQHRGAEDDGDTEGGAGEDVDDQPKHLELELWLAVILWLWRG